MGQQGSAATLDLALGGVGVRGRGLGRRGGVWRASRNEVRRGKRDREVLRVFCNHYNTFAFDFMPGRVPGRAEGGQGAARHVKARQGTRAAAADGWSGSSAAGGRGRRTAQLSSIPEGRARRRESESRGGVGRGLAADPSVGAAREGDLCMH